MAVTRTNSSTNDVAMVSSSTSYATARNGGTITGDPNLDKSGGGIGQNKIGSTYYCYESFFSFPFVAVASTQVLVSEHIDIRSQYYTSGKFRDHEYREFDFGATPDVPGDWRAPSAYSAFPMIGRVGSVNSQFTPYYPYIAGSTALHNRIGTGSTPLRMMANSELHRTNVPPTGNEYAGVVFANYADSGYRPKLVLKTLTNSHLARWGGGSVQLSDGTHVYTTYDGSTVRLVHSEDGTTTSEIDVFDTGTSVGNLDIATSAWQTLSITMDESDNIWIVYKDGANANSIAVQPFTKTDGAYAWTQRPIRTIAMPAYGSYNSDVPINNLAVTWHRTVNDGHLMVIGGHRMGTGDADSMFYASLSCNNLLNLSAGPYIAESGTDPFWMELVGTNSAGTRSVNDTGNCLDVWADGVDGYTITADSTMGTGNDVSTSYVSLAKYTLNTNGTVASGSRISRRIADNKEIEPETKAKIVPLDPGRIAFCYAGEIRVYATSGSYLGGGDFDFLGITYDPWTSAQTDYVYDKAANKVWMYYITAAAPQTLNRRGLSLTNYNWDTADVAVSTTVGAAGSTNPAIRLPRGRTNERNVHIDVANLASGTHSTVVLVDSMNVPPLAPRTGNRENFNASNPANFYWAFNDPNTSDRQTAYQLQITDVSDGSLDYDSSKVTSGGGMHTLAAGSLLNGKTYQWKVRSWDRNDAVGPYSALGTFDTLSSSITTITVPDMDNPADALGSTYAISWTSTVLTQAKYRVVVVNTQTGATVLNTGWVTSTSQSYTLTGLEDGVQYRVEVTIRDSTDTESSTGVRYITPNYIQPSKPVLTITTGDSFIEINAGNPSGPQLLGPQNNDFETDVSGWTATNATFARSTAQAHSGAASGLLTVSGTPSQAYVRPTSALAIPVDPDTMYTLGLWWYATTGASSSRISVDWLSASKSYISTGTSLRALSAATWEYATDDFTSPSNAAYAVMGPTLAGNPPTGFQLYFDEVTFVTADLPLPTSVDIFKSESGADAFKRIANIEPNSTYRDYAVKSGTSYDYYAEAVV